MRWLFEHVEAKERRRDATFPAAAVTGPAARRDLRIAGVGRAATVLGALGLLLLLAFGPAPDTGPLTVLFAVSAPLVVAGLVLWFVGAARLGRREREVRAAAEDGDVSADPG